MAFRLHEQVVRGEIDNRIRGCVTGRVWFIDRSEPVDLAFAGNAGRDLAGRRLTFVNPQPSWEDTSMLKRVQKGVIGDCTASRKVKVPDVSHDELMRLIDAGRPFPWHWGNSLYLEWYSEANGRVVIESATYELTITDGPCWEMSEAEELKQRRANARAMQDFLNRVSDAATGPSQPPAADDGWKPERPMTEVEAEALQAESDKLADRIQARLEREGPSADFDQILHEELERRARERGEKPLSPEEEAERAAWIDEMNRAADDALKNWEPENEPDERHPLVERASELAVRVYTELKERNAIPEHASQEHPILELLNGTMCAGPKLAGALDGESWPPDLEVCASVLVRIKRAHGFLEDALIAADDCAEQKLLDPEWLAGVRAEVEAIARTCEQMIAQLRERLENTEE